MKFPSEKVSAVLWQMNNQKIPASNGKRHKPHPCLTDLHNAFCGKQSFKLFGSFCASWCKLSLLYRRSIWNDAVQFLSCWTTTFPTHSLSLFSMYQLLSVCHRIFFLTAEQRNSFSKWHMVILPEEEGFVICFEKQRFPYSLKHRFTLAQLLVNPGLKVPEVIHYLYLGFSS